LPDGFPELFAGFISRDDKGMSRSLNTSYRQEEGCPVVFTDLQAGVIKGKFTPAGKDIHLLLGMNAVTV
jgi:hypothetical protein